MAVGCFLFNFYLMIFQSLPGAKESEIAVMNTLTVNLHFLMVGRRSAEQIYQGLRL